ncbi:MAG: thiol:disulfide interchange protein, partial [Muribaculaceae bacterium]|nr:thiol:disulfide interchange protein [Muribaculaceae bacterium]
TPIFVQENGKNVKLSTVGDKWSYLQRHKFGSNSQPYYVTLDAQGNLISGPFAYDENIDTFTRFLKAALE